MYSIQNIAIHMQGRQWKHSTTLDGAQTHDHWLSRPVLSTGTVAAHLRR